MFEGYVAFKQTKQHATSSQQGTAIFGLAPATDDIVSEGRAGPGRASLRGTLVLIKVHWLAPCEGPKIYDSPYFDLQTFQFPLNTSVWGWGHRKPIQL